MEHHSSHQHGAHPHGHQETIQHTAHQKSSYTCPMYPEIIRDKRGTCPICGMKLVTMKAIPLLFLPS
ncbi:heavy metal-binding domain-containing protein [Olivibacter ginsenosidimutans]|uniref:heavy metal-binding domain-containing protein n=1 Tax=Olivibacter ginsenosidimutans TaxID=1176537 RepID=UPI003CD0C082